MVVAKANREAKKPDQFSFGKGDDPDIDLLESLTSLCAYPTNMSARKQICNFTWRLTSTSMLLHEEVLEVLIM